MILYLMRHGKAEDRAAERDAERHLTDAGRETVTQVAAGMRALKLRFEVILTSALPRAAETAELVAAAFGGEPKPEIDLALAPGVAPAETAAALRPYAGRGHVLLVGHEPGLSGLASLLMTGAVGNVSIELKKAGLIALEMPPRFDKDAGAKLLYMVAPRHLRRMAR